MALPVVAVMGLSAAAAAGAGIGGTALGLALTLKDRIKHKTSPVTQLMNLSEGKLITVYVYSALPCSINTMVLPWYIMVVLYYQSSTIIIIIIIIIKLVE